MTACRLSELIANDRTDMALRRSAVFASRVLAVPLVCFVCLGSGGCTDGVLPQALGDGLDASSGNDGGAADGAVSSDARAADAAADAAHAETGADTGSDADAAAFDAPICTTPCVHGTCVESGGCKCDPNWAGTLCDAPSTSLTPGTPASGSVMRGTWAYYSWTGLATGVSVTLSETATTGLVWEYLSVGYVPDRTTNLASNEDAQSATHTVTYSTASSGTQTWYVGVYGQPAIPTASQVVAYSIQLTVIP